MLNSLFLCSKSIACIFNFDCLLELFFKPGEFFTCMYIWRRHIVGEGMQVWVYTWYLLPLIGEGSFIEQLYYHTNCGNISTFFRLVLITCVAEPLAELSLLILAT